MDLNIGFNTLEMMVATLESVSKFVPSSSHRWSRRNRENIICKFVRTCWINTKVTVYCIALLPVMRCDIITTSQSQSGSPCGNMWIPHWRRQTFSCNTMTPDSMPDWKRWKTLPVLAGLSYHAHHIAWIWNLLTSMCSMKDGLCKQHSSSNNIIAAVKQ